ncbi:hypothetical protein CVT24_002099, partial [Panaeolus cyanescens]
MLKRTQLSIALPMVSPVHLKRLNQMKTLMSPRMKLSGWIACGCKKASRRRLPLPINNSSAQRPKSITSQRGWVTGLRTLRRRHAH